MKINVSRASKQADNYVWNRLLTIARKKEIDVYSVKGFPNGIFGMYYRYKGIGKICVDATLSDEERNFTMAHELAHYKLHADTVDDVLYNKEDHYHDCIEKKADRFALKLINLLSKEVC